MVSMNLLSFRQASKLNLAIKIFLFIALILLIYNIYYSTSSYEIFKKIRDENITVQNMQDTIAKLMQRGMPRGQILEIDENLSEKEKAEIMGLDDGITEQARRIMKELNITDAGENGNPVIIPDNISEEIKQLNKTLREIYGYNALASSMVSLNRALPDNRSDYCKTKVYPKDLPKASVVIPFHDDDWMLVMRTLHSVLLRTPDRLLEEVLMVFDLSEREYFQEKLDEYLKKMPKKVRLIRSHRRQGIISNRILGARNAVGPVIVFVDSHVEVTPGWIEPMLARIAEEPNTITWAKNPGISTETLKIHLEPSPGALGTFKWHLGFDWMDIKWYEGDKPTPTYAPKPTITFIGPCFAIRKDFFHKIGYFDPDFDVWGGEDVELAFRAWMCGGRVELVPCSTAAHMYKSHTYTMSMNDKGGARYNTDRIAEIWLDEYKRYYYRMVGDTKNRNFGNITERVELKKKLGCKSFKWFLETLHPKMPIPDNIKDPVEITNQANAAG